jgi:hydroxyquinol 1,2-dioxygenase
VRSIGGQPLAGAVIEVWQADAEGHYDVQVEGAGHRARAVFRSDANGRFAFRTVVPQAYPIPDDGPVGELLRAGGRHPWRPAHLHFMVDAPGHELLVTHVFRSDDAYLDSDAVFGVRQSLVADWNVQPDGSGTLRFDFVLAPSE